MILHIHTNPRTQKPYTSMQAEGDHRGGSNTTATAEMNQQQQNQQQPPQKCPRCESLNTKFCYYNNYSLSQPRYFCKTCRRYWTQGGTLRNVPVGGGCRKGKRAKSSSGGDGNSRSQLQPPQAQQLQRNLASTGAISSSTPVIMSKTPASSLGTTIETSALASHYYSGNSGFFSSLPTIHSLNNQPQPFSTQPLNVGGTELGAGSSNFNLLQGFNVSDQRRQMQAGGGQFYNMPNTTSHKSLEVPLYPSEGNLLIQSNRPATTSADNDWPQSFMINKSNASASDHQSAMWSMPANPNSPGNFNTNTTTAGPSLNPDQWPDLGGL